MEKEINMKNTIHTFIIALAMIITLAIGSCVALGQNGSADADSSTIVGVWEAFEVPAEDDCATGAPLPGTPTIRVLNTFNQGGTGWLEDNAPFDGPYRSTGASIWKHDSGRNYAYVNWHYTFNPDKTFVVTIRQKGNLTLSRDGNSFTEKGTFDIIIPDGTVVYSGCFSDTSHRLTF
jgi:hypothetical protein